MGKSQYVYNNMNYGITTYAQTVFGLFADEPSKANNEKPNLRRNHCAIHVFVGYSLIVHKHKWESRYCFSNSVIEVNKFSFKEVFQEIRKF